MNAEHLLKHELVLFVQVEEDEKLKKRKERFGIVTSAASAGADDSEVQHLHSYYFRIKS